MAQRRAHWPEQLAVEPVAALVFVDESGANTKMTRLRGRALGGRRLLAHIPHGHYQTTTLISGLRLEGYCAPWLFGGSMNGEMFLAWVRQGLAPRLRLGDVVILDNLSTHKIRGVRETIEAGGARLLYLPPYSPDFNPIERLWLRLKAEWFCDFIAKDREALMLRLDQALQWLIARTDANQITCTIKKEL